MVDQANAYAGGRVAQRAGAKLQKEADSATKLAKEMAAKEGALTQSKAKTIGD